MKRFSWITALAISACALVAPAGASAAVTELGVTASPLVAPSCPKNVSPANCTIILTQMTALETVRDGLAYPTTVKKAGQIVAFTLGLSNLSSNRTTEKSDIHYLDQTYGGTTRAAITVLKVSGPSKQRRWKVVAESPMFHLQPYLGQVVQIPLTTTLPVTPGEVVALTTSTWLPVLSINLSSSKFAYRQSRTTACNTPPSSSQAQLKVGATAQYSCNYPGTRVEYTATEITNPVAVNPIHAADKPAADHLSARSAPFGRPSRSGGVAVAPR
jgi:hypothetical protein